MNIETETWIQSCHDAFQFNLEKGDLAGCKACIADMFDISPNTAREMNEELRNTPISRFAVKTPYEY